MINQFYIIPRIGGIAYLNMPKSACSSVNIALSQMRLGEGFTPPRQKLMDGSSPIHGFDPPHAHIEYFFRRWPLDLPPLPDSFIKFTFVRNPYDRILSFYRSKIVNNQAPGQYYKKFGLDSSTSFADCVEILTSVDPNELEHHAAPQSMILCNKEILLAEFVGKVEEFNKDWPVIQKLTGFSLRLEHENPTSDGKKPVFTDEIRQRIFDYYREDFELFSYARGSMKSADTMPENPMKKAAFTAHHMDGNSIAKLKKQILSQSAEVRRIAEDFAINPRKRKKHFEKQGELLNELILKHSFHLERNYGIYQREQNALKQRQDLYGKIIDESKIQLKGSRKALTENARTLESLRQDLNHSKNLLEKNRQEYGRLKEIFDREKDRWQGVILEQNTLKKNVEDKTDDLRQVLNHCKNLLEENRQAYGRLKEIFDRDKDRLQGVILEQNTLERDVKDKTDALNRLTDELHEARNTFEERLKVLTDLKQRQQSMEHEINISRTTILKLADDQSNLKNEQKSSNDSMQTRLNDLNVFKANVWKSIEGHGRALTHRKTAIQKNKDDVSRIYELLKRNVLVYYSKSRKRLQNKLYRFLHYHGLNERKILLKSGLVDAAYYFTTYPDTIAGGMSAVEHYVRFGAQEGRNPSHNFNTVQYLMDHPDIVMYGLNPLVHFHLSH